MFLIKKLAVPFAIVLVAVFVDCGLLYYQAATGTRLPFKLNLLPKLGGDF
jgi:hypothetical protein